MEFVSRTDDKTPHWIISEGSPEPKLIVKEKEGRSDEGGGEESQDAEDKEKPTDKGEISCHEPGYQCTLGGFCVSHPWALSCGSCPQ